MFSPLALLAIAAAGAVSVQPATVPARGDQQVLLTVDRTAMVHLSAKSPGGTRCELVDQLQGPFLESGTAGRSSCDVDALLDPGPYLLRLESPRKGKGQVAIAAAAFTEVNSPLLRLAPGRRLERPLHPREQASYWIHLEKRAFVPLQVWGRTAGAVRLWRNGEWAEPSQPRPEVVSPKPNQPIYRWQYGDFLEAGDYPGLLRLRTDGELDPRCRLYDARGRLVAASSGRGAGWNCEFSEPLPAGNYRLAIESETLQSGTTRVSAAMAASVDAAAPEVGKAVGLAVGPGSAQVSLPAPGTSVQEVRLRSKAPFSSALASGISAERCIDRTECSFLPAPSTSGAKLLVWRAGASSEKVDFGLAARAVAERGPGRIAQAEVVKAQVPKSGLYRTGQGVLCLPAGSQGVFASCGPEISLEQGPTLFASLGDGKLSLDEIVEIPDRCGVGACGACR